VYKIKNLKSGQGPTKDCRARDIFENRRKNSMELFLSNLYFDFTQFNLGDIALVPRGNTGIYSLKNNGNWRQNH
jgi:hypothetical protein